MRWWHIWKRSEAHAAVLVLAVGTRVTTATAQPEEEERLQAETFLTAAAISPDDRVAVTADAGGRIRYWPALDGSAPPRDVPIARAVAFSIAHVARRSVVLALIDEVGAGHVLRVVGRRFEVVYGIAPIPELVSLEVLDTGEVVALGRDGALRLYDADGAERDRFELRRFRIVAAPVAPVTHRVFAIAAIDPAIGAEIRLLQVRDGRFVREGAVLHEPLAPADAVWRTNADGTRLVEANGHIFVVLDTVRGTRAAGEAVAEISALGFGRANRVIVGTAFYGAFLEGARPGDPPTPMVDGLVPVLAVGRSRVLATRGPWLAVFDLDPAASRFLGFDPAVHRAEDGYLVRAPCANAFRVYLAAPPVEPGRPVADCIP